MSILSIEKGDGTLKEVWKGPNKTQIFFLNDSREWGRWLFPFNILIAIRLLIKIRGNSECSQPVQRIKLI